MCSLEFELLSEVSGSATAAKMKVMEVMVDVGGGEAREAEERNRHDL